MPTPVTNFRLGPEVLEALDAIVEKFDDNRTAVVRRLILDEHARVGLGREAAGAFVDRLVDRFGEPARLRFDKDLGGDVELRVGTELIDDLFALAVFDIGNVALIYLGDPDSTVRLQVGSLPAFGGSIEVPLASLRQAPLGWDVA